MKQAIVLVLLACFAHASPISMLLPSYNNSSTLIGFKSLLWPDTTYSMELSRGMKFQIFFACNPIPCSCFLFKSKMQYTVWILSHVLSPLAYFNQSSAENVQWFNSTAIVVPEDTVFALVNNSNSTRVEVVGKYIIEDNEQEIDALQITWICK